MFICDTMGSGGAERVIATLSNGFIDNGHSVSILMLSPVSDGSFYKLDDNVALFKLPNAKSGFFKKIKSIKRVVVENKPDVVVSFLSYVCIYTWRALKGTNIPYVVSERNDPNHRGRIKQFLLNKSFKNAAGCVFQTEDALKWYKNISREKSIVIHNPINLDYYADVIPNTKKQILYVGRLNEQKNCSMLINAFKKFDSAHPGYSLKMYGSGHLESDLRKQISDNNLEEKVLIIPNSKTWQKDEFDSAMFVLGSKFEGMPNVLAEALSLGIPSVSTDCPIGGPKELKKFFPNLLVLSENDSVLSFARAMEEASRIEHSKLFIPKELSEPYIVEKWLNFIDKILKGKQDVR